MHGMFQLILLSLLPFSDDVQKNYEDDVANLAIKAGNYPRKAIAFADKMIEKYVKVYGRNEYFYGIYAVRAKAHIKLSEYDLAITDANLCAELNRSVGNKLRQEALDAKNFWRRLKWGSIGAGIAAAAIGGAIAGGVIGYQRTHAPHAPSDPPTPLVWSLTIPF